MGIDPEKLFVLFVIALVVLGPERLPKMARSMGRGLAELRRYTATARAELDEVLAEPRSAVQSALRDANLEDLSDLAALRSPLRYIDATSRARRGGPELETGEDGVAGGLSGGLDGAGGGDSGPASGALSSSDWVAAEPSDLPLPDDPALN